MALKKSIIENAMPNFNFGSSLKNKIYTKLVIEQRLLLIHYKRETQAKLKLVDPYDEAIKWFIKEQLAQEFPVVQQTTKILVHTSSMYFNPDRYVTSGVITRNGGNKTRMYGIWL